MTDWNAWLGRETTQSDILDPALARRWMAAFNLQELADSVMPQGIHFCLCTPEALQSALGEDGHPARDNSDESFFPPIPLPRRMWAASEITFKRPLLIGSSVERASRIASVAEKEGKSGKLGFVEVEHVTKADGEEAICEKQTLVYREANSPDAPLTPPAPGANSFAPSGWDAHELGADVQHPLHSL